MNPGQSVKDRAALYIIQDAVTARHAAAGRHGGGRHRGQYRHRPDRHRQRAGLPHRHRHPRDAEPGEEGRAAPARRPPRGGAGAALQEPQQLRALLGAPGARSSPRPSPTAPSGPTNGTTPPTAAPTSRARPRRSGPTPRARSTASSPRSARGNAGRRLRRPQGQAQRDIQIALADVPGAALYSYYTTGVLKSEGSSITEGIGQGRVTKNIEGAVVDRAYLIPDAESVAVCFQLLQEEGLCMGGSTGVNVAGAIRLAKEMGPGHTIVTLLCDYGTRYQSKLFDPAFLSRRTCRCPMAGRGAAAAAQDVRRSRHRRRRRDRLSPALPCQCRKAARVRALFAGVDHARQSLRRTRTPGYLMAGAREPTANNESAPPSPVRPNAFAAYDDHRIVGTRTDRTDSSARPCASRPTPPAGSGSFERSFVSPRASRAWTAVALDWDDKHDRAALPRRCLPARLHGARARRQRARRHRARPHRVLCRGRRAARRQGLPRGRRRRHLPHRHDSLRCRQDHHRARAGRGRARPAPGQTRARRARLGHALASSCACTRRCTCCARW